MPASFRQRVVAFLYDYLLISVYLILLATVTTVAMKLMDSDSWAGFFSNPFRADLVAFLTTVLPVSLYFAVCESSTAMASFGKKRIGLTVKREGGQRLRLSTSLVRSFLKFLPWQIAHTCLFHIPGWPLAVSSPDTWVYIGIGIMWLLVIAYLSSIAFSKENRAVYDKLLGIRVFANS